MSTFDYDGTLRARVIAAGGVRADDVISDQMADEAVDAISAFHEGIARYWLALGFPVVLEGRNLDGSLFCEKKLAPAPESPEGFVTVYIREFSP